MTTSTCRGCEAQAEGNFCAACGQRQPKPGDFSLRHLVDETWSELSNTDSRLWRSLAGIFRPGLLTAAWLDYRWQKYLPPLRLYVLMSGIYFLLAFDVTFQLTVDQVLAMPESAMPARLRAVYLDPAAAALAGDLTALMKFLFVVPMGLWIALLHLRNRQPIGAHMVFAIHYTVLDFAVYSLQALLLVLAPATWDTSVFSATLPLGMGVLLLWSVLAVRRVYARSWPSSVLRGLAVVAMDVVLSVLAGQLAIAMVITSKF